MRKTPKKGFISPMLATLVEDIPSAGQWVYEKKFDGYRIIATKFNHQITLYSRRGIILNADYPPVVAALSKIPHNFTIDGEIINLDKQGKETFQGLQQYTSTRSGVLEYCAFDLLELDGADTTALILLQRKELLSQLLKSKPTKIIRYVKHVFDPRQLFRQAEREGWEGIIGKQTASTYLPGKRSYNFIKIKTSKRQEVIICGYTAPAGTRKYFGALLLGVYIEKTLHYIGKTGTGFTHAILKELYQIMERYKSNKSPFKEEVKDKYYRSVDITWLKPTLVCEIKFAEWTNDLRMRHPSFQGLRKDKPAKQVVIEKPQQLKN